MGDSGSRCSGSRLAKIGHNKMPQDHVGFVSSGSPQLSLLTDLTDFCISLNSPGPFGLGT